MNVFDDELKNGWPANLMKRGGAQWDRYYAAQVSKSGWTTGHNAEEKAAVMAKARLHRILCTGERGFIYLMSSSPLQVADRLILAVLCNAYARRK